MTDPRRAAFERNSRKQFGRGNPLVVAEEVIKGLRSRFRTPTWEAWAAAAELMGAHGREPTMAELRKAIAAANSGRRSADPGERQRAAGSLYCGLRALGRWRMHEGGDAVRIMGPVTVRDYISDLSTDPREEEALAAAMVDAVQRLATKGSYGQFVVADARTMHAVALLRLADADAREAGRALLAEQVEAMERLLADVLVLPGGVKADERILEVSRGLHAMALNNLAQAWEQRVEGERAENLRRAIALYEQCCKLPARIAEPEKLLHSLHHLALCLRNLAHEAEDVTERGALLRRAGDVADHGLDLPRQHPREPFPMLEALRLNRANTEAHWLLWQKETGALSPEDADRRLREHCRASLAWLGTSTLRERAEGHMAAAFFAQALGQEGHAQTEEDAIAALHALVGKIVAPRLNEVRFMTRDEAELALSAMTTLTPEGKPSPTVARPEVHSCMPIVLGGVHPLHIGVVTARGLYGIELAWLGSQLRPLGPLGRKYIEDAISGMHRWMCDADLPQAHRRVFAAQIGRLAALALDPAIGLVELDTLDRVRLHDLSGVAFYRAESTFYGQGPSHEAPLATEAGWRINLYRARQDLDHCATLYTYEELRPLIEHVQPGALDQVLATMRTYVAYSPEGTTVREFRRPLEEMSRVRAEILDCRRFGQPRGWRPAHVETTPAPQRDEIAAWLHENPTMALLLAGGDELGLVHVEGAGEVVYQRFAELCGDGLPGMQAQADALANAWESLLLGHPDAAPRALIELDTALRRVMLDRAWRGLADRLAAELARCGLTCVVVVERGPWRAFPWGSLPVGEGTLADRAAIVHLPTLAATGAQPSPLREGTLAYLGAPEGTSPGLEFGRAVFRGAGAIVVSALEREAFERACVRAGVLRVFSHGAFNSIDAPLSGIVLNDADPEELPYQGYEIATMDLRGCGRVELWACESGVQMDFLGNLLGNDEPLGIASCFLLAGARVVIGSLWKQPAVVAGLIAAAFIAVVSPPGSAERDAHALGQALTAYRRAVDEGGVFEDSFCRSLAESLRRTSPDAGAVAHAIHTAWCETATRLAGSDAIGLPLVAVQEFQEQDALLEEARRVVDDPGELDQELRRVSRRLLAFLRGPVAWAGWRVLARDRSVL